MKGTSIPIVTLVASLAVATKAADQKDSIGTAPIKAFCVDFNWGPGGPNGFAKPGLWADADPAQHVAWYERLGCNVTPAVLRSLGDHLIVELPNEHNACGQNIVKEAVNATLPADAQLIGRGQSHLDGGTRPSASDPVTETAFVQRHWRNIGWVSTHARSLQCDIAPVLRCDAR